MGRVQRDRVVAVAEPDLEGVEAGVADAQTHAHAREFVTGEDHAFGSGIATVKDLEHVSIAFTGIQRQSTQHAVHVGIKSVELAVKLAHIAHRGANPDDVVAGTRIDTGGTGDSLDIEPVIATAADDQGFGHMCAANGQHIAGIHIAQVQAQEFQPSVRHTAARTQKVGSVGADQALRLISGLGPNQQSIDQRIAGQGAVVHQ